MAERLNSQIQSEKLQPQNDSSQMQEVPSQGMTEIFAGYNPIFGTDEDDDLVGTEKSDAIFALDGEDTVNEGAFFGGNDLIFGGKGDDGNSISSPSGTFPLEGLFGREGNDRLFGNEGNDVLTGGRGMTASLVMRVMMSSLVAGAMTASLVVAAVMNSLTVVRLVVMIASLVAVAMTSSLEGLVMTTFWAAVVMTASRVIAEMTTSLAAREMTI